MASRLGPAYEFLDFRLIPGERLLLRKGEPVALTPKVFDTLVVLVERAGSLVEKDEILLEVWGDVHIEEANVARSVWLLRQALGDDRNGHRVIQTVPKKGYRFVAAVAEVDANGSETIRPPAAPISATTRGRAGRRALWLGIVALIFVAASALIYRSALVASGQPAALDPASMRQVRLTRSGDVYAPVVSGDGEHIVYYGNVDGKAALCLMQLATGKVLALVPQRPGVSFWGAAFSPDGSYVYYTEGTPSGDAAIYRVSALGGQPQKIVDDALGPYISRDGRRLGFKRVDKQNRRTMLIVANIDGSDERVITSTDTDSGYLSVDWAPDGSTLAYVFKQYHPDGNRWYVAEVPAGGGPERRIGTVSESRIYSALWLPDMTGFAMTALDPETRQMQLFHLAYPDGTHRRITNDLTGYSGISITTDGSSIVAQRTDIDREIWIAATHDPSLPAWQLTDRKAQHFDDLSWSSSESLVYDVDESETIEKHNLWSMSLNDPVPRRLTDGDGHNYHPRVSPDGQVVTFISHRSGRPQLWRMRPDGTGAAPVTQIDSDVLDMQFAPDSRTIYFTTWTGGRGQLMRVTLDERSIFPVFDDADIFLWAVSPDGERVAYSSRDPVTKGVVTIVRRLDDGVIEHTLDLEPFNCLQWSADGSELYFAQRVDNAQNIWRRSLRTSAPRQLTGFTDKKLIRRFTVSPGGDQIALVRFTESHDAVALNFGK